MKKIKIIAFVSGALTLLQLIPTILSGIFWVKFNIDLKEASAIGIIGGADGPTAIYTAGTVPTRYGFLIISALIFIVSMIMCLRKRSK